MHSRFVSASKAPILLGCALIATGCATRAPRVPDTVEPAPPVEAEPSAAIEAPAPLPPRELVIAAVGDMMIGTDYPFDHLPDDDGLGFLQAVTPLLSSADIAFGNLEGVLLNGGTAAKKCSNPSACYLFRSPTRYAQRFADAGFDAISLANNHARDFGEEGRTSSMQSLAALGIRHSGRVDDFAEWVDGDVRIALAAYAVTKNSNMMLDVDLAAATVFELASRNDIVIVSFHGGAEGLDALHIPFAEETYYDEPRGDVVEFARTMIDAGADLVLGHGPHVVRGMELYRNRLIAYSLGNFATYYGISVAGLKGIAPVLVSTVNRDGEFVSGHIHSTRQIRPDGPSLDPDRQALRWIRQLSFADFGNPGLRFSDDGEILPE